MRCSAPCQQSEFESFHEHPSALPRTTREGCRFCGHPCFHFSVTGSLSLGPSSIVSSDIKSDIEDRRTKPLTSPFFSMFCTRTGLSSPPILPEVFTRRLSHILCLVFCVTCGKDFALSRIPTNPTQHELLQQRLEKFQRENLSLVCLPGTTVSGLVCTRSSQSCN